LRAQSRDPQSIGAGLLAGAVFTSELPVCEWCLGAGSFDARTRSIRDMFDFNQKNDRKLILDCDLRHRRYQDQ